MKSYLIDQKVSEWVYFFVTKDQKDMPRTGSESDSISCGKEETVFLGPAFLMKGTADRPRAQDLLT